MDNLKFTVSGMFSIYMMVSSTKIQKTGSKYGTEKVAKKSEWIKCEESV